MYNAAGHSCAQINTARATWLVRAVKAKRTALEITSALDALRSQRCNSFFDFSQVLQSLLNQLFWHLIFFR